MLRLLTVFETLSFPAYESIQTLWFDYQMQTLLKSIVLAKISTRNQY